LAKRGRRRPFGVRHVSIISRGVHCPCTTSRSDETTSKKDAIS
jgi:hypothetical protein